MGLQCVENDAVAKSVGTSNSICAVDGLDQSNPSSHATPHFIHFISFHAVQKPLKKRPLARKDFVTILQTSRPSKDAAFDYFRRHTSSNNLQEDAAREAAPTGNRPLVNVPTNAPASIETLQMLMSAAMAMRSAMNQPQPAATSAGASSRRENRGGKSMNGSADTHNDKKDTD